MEMITAWMDHYGYGVLFSALLLELLALPFPGEALMSYAGLLIFQGTLHWFPALLAAFSGCAIGITLSYWIGFRLGSPFFHKYGHYIHVGPERVEKVSRWFGKYGNKLLLIACFIPGIRHFTGYFSGINRLPFRTFALYAYTGAFVWTGTFLSLGRVLGPEWEHFHGIIKKYFMIAAVVIAAAIVLYMIYKNNKMQIKEQLLGRIARLAAAFHSLGRVKFLIAVVSIAGILLFIVMVSLIQDLLANEFKQFDEVVGFLVFMFLPPTWTPWMQSFALIASVPILVSVAVLSLVGILLTSKDRNIEAFFLCFVSLGAEVFGETARRVFHRPPPILSSPEPLSYTFPSETTLLATAVYGFVAFLLIRHLKNSIGRAVAGTVFFSSSLLLG